MFAATPCCVGKCTQSRQFPRHSFVCFAQFCVQNRTVKKIAFRRLSIPFVIFREGRFAVKCCIFLHEMLDDWKESSIFAKQMQVLNLNAKL